MSVVKDSETTIEDEEYSTVSPQLKTDSSVHSKVPLFTFALLKNVIKVFLGETFGTFFMVFFGCIGLEEYKPKAYMEQQFLVIFSNLTSQKNISKDITYVTSVLNGTHSFECRYDDFCKINSFRTGIVWGFAVTACITIFEPFSGAHLNPCATITGIILGHNSPLLLPVYLIAQCLGSFMASFIRMNLATTTLFTCVPYIHPEITVIRGFFLEFIGTTLLVFAVCNAMDPRTGKYLESAVPIKLGMTVAVIVFGICEMTGASLNPARSFGPVIHNNAWKNFHIYVGAQILATLLVSLIYKFLFLKKEDTSEELTERG